MARRNPTSPDFPDTEHVQETVQRGLARAAARKTAAKAIEVSAAKAGVKLGAKIGGKYVAAPVGAILGAVEAAPIAFHDLKEMYHEDRRAGKEIRGHLKEKKYKEAAKTAAKAAAKGQVSRLMAGARAGAAFFGSKEIAELIPTGTQAIDMAKKALANGKKNKGPSPQGVPYLLALMLALRTAYQYAHWNTLSYPNHLLFERLYKTLDEDIDSLAELAVYAKQTVKPLEVKFPQLEEAERSILKICDRILEQEKPNKGLENFLLNLIEHRERALYLLAMATKKGKAYANPR